jgi:predicted small lipoprotein YifL
MHKPTLFGILISLSLCFLSSCGLKGPLYLPEAQTHE